MAVAVQSLEARTEGVTPLVACEGITKSFGGVHALRGVDFELLPGEVHALLGQNGAGKSTLIKILSGVNQKDGGRVRIDGEEMEFRTPAASRAAGLAVVYQELSLIPSLSVAANIYLAREPHNALGLVKRRQLVREARRFLEAHGLPLDPRATVGGLPFPYRQLTEIAKALAGNVKILILDEPTSALSGGEEDILFHAIEQVTSRGVGVVYVTHRLSEVFRISHRVTVLRDGLNVGTFATTKTDMASLVSAIVGPAGEERLKEAMVVGLGPHGETAASPEELELTVDESATARAGRYRVGIVLHTGDSDWSREQVRGITETLAAHGAEVLEVVDPRFDAAAQVAGVERLVERRPDAIIALPVDDATTASAFARLAQAGIELVLMDNAPAGLQAGRDYATVVSADNYANGVEAARLLAPYVPASATVGIVGYGVDFFATNERVLGFRKWMRDNRPDVELVERTFATPTGASAAAVELLDAYPELSGLFVVWDEPALDVLATLRERGQQIPVTTVDLGARLAIELARGDVVKGVGAQRPYDQGAAEALAALGALLGKELPPWVALPALPVTPESVAERWERVWHAPPPAEIAAAAASSTAPAAAAGAERAPAARPPALLELRGVRNERLKGASLTVGRGEIVGLAGTVGAGRTEILETIFGLRRVREGEIVLDGQPLAPRGPREAIERGIALVPEDRHIQGLVLDHSIERNVALPRLPYLARLGLFRRRASSERAAAAIGELSIKAPSVRTPLRNLSGGNQQKVVFGKWRDPSPVLLLLDEPTVGVDVGARAEIYDVVRRLARAGQGVLVVSSELVELLLLCDRVAIVADGRIVAEHPRAEIENEEHLHRLVQESQS